VRQKKAKMIRRHARKLTAKEPHLYKPITKLLKKAYKSKQKKKYDSIVKSGD
jgi:hypothetical protein